MAEFIKGSTRKQCVAPTRLRPDLTVISKMSLRLDWSVGTIEIVNAAWRLEHPSKFWINSLRLYLACAFDQIERSLFHSIWMIVPWPPALEISSFQKTTYRRSTDWKQAPFRRLAIWSTTQCKKSSMVLVPRGGELDCQSSSQKMPLIPPFEFGWGPYDRHYRR